MYNHQFIHPSISICCHIIRTSPVKTCFLKKSSTLAQRYLGKHNVMFHIMARAFLRFPYGLQKSHFIVKINIVLHKTEPNIVHNFLQYSCTQHHDMFIGTDKRMGKAIKVIATAQPDNKTLSFKRNKRKKYQSSLNIEVQKSEI